MAEGDRGTHNVSRRDLLRNAGALTLFGSAAGGAGPIAFGATTPPGSPSRDAADPAASTHAIETDVVVVGGGMAGTCAAVAAARNGARVVLIQDRPVLGGNASSEVRLHVLGADWDRQDEPTGSRESGIIDELRLEDAVRNPQRSFCMWDLLLEEWVQRESNITLLLNTACVGVKTGRLRQIDAVRAIRPVTEDEFVIYAKQFIDCSGDGRLGAEAGAAFRMGREGRSEFNESLAPEQPDDKTLGSTILFMTRQHDRPMPFVAPPGIQRFPRCEDLPHRRHGRWDWGFWWVEFGGELDTIKDGEQIRRTLLMAALGVWDHIKNSGHHPDSANWALEWIGALPGKRESRRFEGDYILTQADLEAGRVFDDGVAYGGWPIDLHPPGGINSPERPCHQVRVPLYSIPFRCLYSRNVSNLLFAGRNISASHVAFGSTRVMATCSTEGQAVGTAAAMCAKNGWSPRQLGESHIDALRQQLLKDDGYVMGAVNRDPLDRARGAKVAASSQLPQAPASHVINGVHRQIDAATNQWRSDPNQPMPQWIELTFPAPVAISEVRLTFDTGFHRQRTATYNPGMYARMIHGPQPETVRDYQIEVIGPQGRRTLARIEGNYQRHRVHRFDTAEVTALRITVTATNGVPSARLFEIRAYG